MTHGREARRKLPPCVGYPNGANATAYGGPRSLLSLEELPPLGKVRGDAPDVAAHRRAGLGCVSRLEGGQDGPVLADRRRAHLGRLEVLFHAVPHGAATSIPGAEDDRPQLAV